MSSGAAFCDENRVRKEMGGRATVSGAVTGRLTGSRPCTSAADEHSRTENKLRDELEQDPPQPRYRDPCGCRGVATGPEGSWRQAAQGLEGCGKSSLDSTGMSREATAGPRAGSDGFRRGFYSDSII